MKRLAVALAISVLVLLISGCGQLGGKRDKGSDLPEIYVGTEGLAVGFAPESVPSIVTAESSFDVVLLVANKGAVDIPNAIITVKDTKGVFTLEEVKNGEVFAFEKPLPLIKFKNPFQGKESSASAVGTVEGLTLTLKAKKVNDTQAGLLTTTCYGYGTKLTANVCIDSSSYSFQKQRKPCDAKVPIALKSQGAPVAVKKIETLTEKSGGYVRPKFKIYIGNVGTGLIIDKGSLNLFCTNQTPKKDIRDKINVVMIDKVELNNELLACSEKSKVLSGNLANDFVLCAYPDNARQKFEDGSGTFATPLKVELSYGYTSTSDPVPVKVEKGIAKPATPAVVDSGVTTPTPSPTPTPTPAPTQKTPQCGDNQCSGSETCSNCERDCGKCPSAITPQPTPTIAVTPVTPLWIEYTGDKLPTKVEGEAKWSFLAATGEYYQQIENGMLHVETESADLYYKAYNPEAAYAKSRSKNAEFTFETRLKIVNNGEVEFRIRPYSEIGELSFVLHSDRIYFGGFGGDGFDTQESSNKQTDTTVFHTYRITSTATGAKLYIDNTLALSSSSNMRPPYGGDEFLSVIFGSRGDYYLDYLKHTDDGAFPP